MLFYVIIVDNFVVYYSKNVNFVIIEMVYEFLFAFFFLIVHTFITDIVVFLEIQ